MPYSVWRDENVARETTEARGRSKPVRLVGGKFEASIDKTIYGRNDLPLDRFDEASLDEKAELFVSGRLLESAIFSDGFHR